VRTGDRAIPAMLYYDTPVVVRVPMEEIMATASSATDQGRQPLDAPFLRQPPPTAEELLRCGEPRGLLKPEDWPQVDHLVTEDDTPVDNIYCSTALTGRHWCRMSW
jgi:hypothetical protein